MSRGSLTRETGRSLRIEGISGCSGEPFDSPNIEFGRRRRMEGASTGSGEARESPNIEAGHSLRRGGASFGSAMSWISPLPETGRSLRGEGASTCSMVAMTGCGRGFLDPSSFFVTGRSFGSSSWPLLSLDSGKVETGRRRRSVPAASVSGSFETGSFDSFVTGRS